MAHIHSIEASANLVSATIFHPWCNGSMSASKAVGERSNRSGWASRKENMELGFTGTRDGMSYGQVLKVFQLLKEYNPEVVSHGDCLGADHDFHVIAKYLGFKIRGHPPVDPKLRAFEACDELAEEKEYLLRNKDIVDESDLLIATPKEYSEQWRGGTWSTVRYAKKQKKPVIIVWPNGLAEEFKAGE